MKHIENINSIYKYCSEEIAELILMNKSVRLNTPEMFNDPFDTNLVFSETDMRLVKEALLNYHLDQNFKQVIKEHYSQFKFYQKVIVFFAKITIKLNEITNKQRKEFIPAMNYSKFIRVFARLGFKNGQQGSPSQDALEKYIEVYKSKDIQNTMADKLYEDTQKFLITCFSKNNSSPLMWAHYANKNRGVCIEFENEGFLEVQYTNSRKPLKLKRIIGRILWSYHTSSKISVDDSSNKRFLITLAPLLTKSQDWAYEEEVRCIVSSSNPKVKFANNMHFYEFSSIRSITLGCRMQEHIGQRIIDYCIENKINVYKMKLSDKTFDLERVNLFEKV